MHDKILNFRNIADIKVDSGVIKPHLFYRGGPFFNLNDETIHTLQHDLKIKTVIDFRDSHELKLQPNHQEGFHIIRLNVLGDRKRGLINPDKLIERVNFIGSKMWMNLLYRSMVLSKRSQDAFRQYFEILLNNQDPIYTHCSAGKDRTGLASALFLKMLGASDADIMTEYLLTNTLSKVSIDKRLEHLNQKKKLKQRDIDMIHAYAGVYPEYLETAFNTIQKKYGSFENYFDKVLGMNTQRISQLKEIYIESR